MGWKSTMNITRARALELIQSRLINATDDQLGNAVESLGFGDDPDLEYHGHNFIVSDEPDERTERAEYDRLKQKFEGT